jgi:hypothetical protein
VIGILIGTYSSIAVAAPMLVAAPRIDWAHRGWDGVLFQESRKLTLTGTCSLPSLTRRHTKGA